MNNKAQDENIFEKRRSENGYSLIEMLIVITIMAIISVVAIMSLTAPKLYEAESQTLQIIDIFQEARQRSLSQRTTMRVEINATLRMVRLIDERTANNANDDIVIKNSRYMDNGVYIGSSPSNVSNSPTELSPVPVLTFSPSNHPLSNGNSVIVLRFQRNGTVVNAGSNATGANSVPTGGTIHVWSKYPNDASTNPSIAQISRAITVQAGSGLTKMWKCPFTNGTCSTWIK